MIEDIRKRLTGFVKDPFGKAAQAERQEQEVEEILNPKISFDYDELLHVFSPLLTKPLQIVSSDMRQDINIKGHALRTALEGYVGFITRITANKPNPLREAMITPLRSIVEQLPFSCIVPTCDGVD